MSRADQAKGHLPPLQGLFREDGRGAGASAQAGMEEG